MVMHEKWKIGHIAIKDLWLWDENPRFPQEYFNRGTEELIEYYLSKKDLKILDFSKEVVSDFDLPQLEKLVVLEMNGKNIVLEGNRRLAVYKLLANPSLITKRNDLKKHFEEQKGRINITESFTLEANITTYKEEGLRYVDRKHNRNNNEVGWGEPERRHFAVRRSRGGMKDVVRVALANAVKQLSLPDDLKEAVLGKGFVTTFYRIVDRAATRAKLGYEPKEDGTLQINNQEAFDNLLKVIVYNVLAKKDFNGDPVDSRSLNKVEALDAYIKQLKPDDADLVDKDIREQSKSDLFAGQTPLKKSDARRTPITSPADELFGRKLQLQKGPVNTLYCGILDVYERFKGKEHVMPIIGMSLRLILDVAGRLYYEGKGETVAQEDQISKRFIKEAKTALKKSLNQKTKNSTSLTLDWVSDKYSLEGILHKYAHGNIDYSKQTIVQASKVVADILEYYFKK